MARHTLLAADLEAGGGTAMGEIRTRGGIRREETVTPRTVDIQHGIGPFRRKQVEVIGRLPQNGADIHIQNDRRIGTHRVTHRPIRTVSEDLEIGGQIDHVAGAGGVGAGLEGQSMRLTVVRQVGGRHIEEVAVIAFLFGDAGRFHAVDQQRLRPFDRPCRAGKRCAACQRNKQPLAVVHYARCTGCTGLVDGSQRDIGSAGRNRKYPHAADQ